MDDTRDRLIALEVQVRHLTDEHKDTHDKVTELHNLLMQAKGARLTVFLIAAAAGFGASWLPTIAGWFTHR